LLWSKHEVNLPRRSILRELAIQHKQNSFLSRILRGERCRSLATIVKLTRARDVKVADFFKKT